MKLNLRRTWYEISEYLGGMPRPLRIAEVINRLPARSWLFRSSFDVDGRITVEIDCTPPVPDSDARALLDGSIEELFFAERVLLRQTGGYLAADTAGLLTDPPPSNVIDFEDSGRSAQSLIALQGFYRSAIVPRELQQGLSLRSYLLDNTWLGSPEFEGTKHVVEWRMFGSSETILPTSRYKNRLGTALRFTIETALYDKQRNHIGRALFHTSDSVKKDEIYTTFGPLRIDFANPWTAKRPGHRWIAEIGGRSLSNAIVRGRPTAGLVRDLVQSLDEALSSVLQSPKFQSYTRTARRQQETVAANRLRSRQERAQKASKVVVGGVPLMVSPTCENEVLALLCKLDALGALPFHEFRLWEYTARIGIDALASYRVRPIDVPRQYAALELEYYFENFCDHEHPHQQVNLVVCWDFRDGDVPAGLRRKREWLFQYGNDESFLVLLLSRIPELRIEGR